MNEHMQTIEINGVKMEVDLRQARRVDTFRIGTKVKLLEKDAYGGQKVYAGIVIGFEPFESLPTIIVAYIASDYLVAKVEFAYINASEKSRAKWEVVASVDDDLPMAKATILERMESEIRKAQATVEDLQRKRDYFLEHFGAYFSEPVAA